MSLWNNLVQLQPSVMDRLRENYGDRFPLEIRQFLADWLEQRLLHTVPEKEPTIEAEMFFNEFLAQLQQKASEMIHGEMTPANFRLMESARNLRQLYGHNTLELYNHLRKCLKFEENFLRNPDIFPMRENNEGAEITKAFENLISKARVIENDNRNLKNEFEIFYLQFHQTGKIIAQYEMMALEKPECFEQIEEIKRAKNDKILNFLSNLMGKKVGLIEKFKTVVAEAEGIQKVVLEKYLNDWIINQKLIAKGDAIKSTVKLDTIQNWCENLAKNLWSIREQVKMCINYSQQVHINNQTHDELPEILNSATKLLENLIVRSFIIENPPPQLILIKKKFTSTVRLLIGNSLNINTHKPQVTARIVSEKQVQEVQQTNHCNESCGKIVNNSGYMEYNEMTKILSLNFTMLLPLLPKEMSVVRKERIGPEKVTDKKFALLFQSMLTIGDLKCNVWTLSLPIVVLSHSNQKPDARATITWDNAFSEINRIPFAVPDKVLLSRLGEALSMKFRAETGRGLSPENLHFLCEKVCRTKLQTINDQIEITWNQFCKEILPNRNFTFWEWFYRIMKLTEKHLRGPWNEGLIIGFMDKEVAKENLMRCQNGTFLLRFSDSELGGISVALMEDNYVMHLEPFTEKDLVIRGLPESIRDVESMRYLFPNIPKNQAFEKYIQGNRINVRGNYVRRGIRVLVLPLNNITPNNTNFPTVLNDHLMIGNDIDFQMEDRSLSLPHFDASFMSPQSFQTFTTICN